MGGPSGADTDGGFNPMPASIDTHTNVDEFSKDDHSINVKNKDVYPPPPAPIPYGVAMAPGMGPFSKAGPKRSYPHGGTAEGGPSGNDEGQVFDMPITGNFYTNVDEESKDDHSIKLKNEHIYPPPPPVFVPPPGPVGPPFREAKQEAPKHYHVPAEAFEKRWGPEEGGTAIGGPGGGAGPVDGPAGFPYPVQAGGTAMGGPSGEDDGLDFDNGIHAHFHTNVNENYKDDHSVDLKHTDVFPPPPPVEFGPPGFGGPFKRGWEPEQGGTAQGGPSGNDGGQEFNMPITVNTHTDVDEDYQDDHSIDVKHKDVYPPPPPPAFPAFGGPGPVVPEGGVTPFRRAYSPSSEERTAGGGGGGTAEGGPSGEDDGINFGGPTDVGVDSNVSENHVDNHAIKADSTDIHPPVAVPVPEHCAPEIHNVVHTVTKTATQVIQETATVTEIPKEHVVDHIRTIHETHTVHDVHTVTVTGAAHVVEDPHTVYVTPSEHVVQVTDTVTAPAAHVVEATETVYASPSRVVESQAVPMSQAPMVTPASKILYNVQSTQFASMPAVPSSSHMAQQSYQYRPHAPASSGYSMIPVEVPVASPSSSVASPSSSVAGKIMPSGVDPMHSSMASASATPSHGIMFTGDAARLSGGIVSAAAAVMGVLAFIL